MPLFSTENTSLISLSDADVDVNPSPERVALGQKQMLEQEPLCSLKALDWKFDLGACFPELNLPFFGFFCTLTFYRAQHRSEELLCSQQQQTLFPFLPGGS